MKKAINIVHLYAQDMNTYGDNGNVLVIKKRLERYGYEPIVIEYNPGDKFPEDADIILGGGGQDSGQGKIQQDLLDLGPKLIELANKNVPMLMVCGLYQSFGKFFKTRTGQVIKGISLFDIETYGKNERLIGNITINSGDFGDMVGYENHSGQTYLGQNMEALGRVILGAGNNTDDISEGARYKNVIGTYLHGSVLPKNPKLADFLIKQACINKYGSFTNIVLDDSLANKAREIAMTRPR